VSGQQNASGAAAASFFRQLCLKEKTGGHTFHLPHHVRPHHAGASDGYVRLWHVFEHLRGLKPVMAIPEAGYINSLAFNIDGSLLAAGVGQVS
jgi:hypothetical protein